MKKIRTKEELVKALETGGWVDFFIQLNYGLRSSKQMQTSEKIGYVEVLHGIDGSIEEVSIDEMMKGFIGEAMKKGDFYLED